MNAHHQVSRTYVCPEPKHISRKKNKKKVVFENYPPLSPRGDLTKVACGDEVGVKMNTKHVRNAIMNLLERELYRPGWTFEELGEKIEGILNFTPIMKREIDKNAPKRTRTAYTFFCQENRPETVKNMEKDGGGESVKSVDVVRALAKRWKELSYRVKIKCKIH